MPPTNDDITLLELEGLSPEEIAAKEERNRRIWLLIHTVKMGLIETAYLVGNPGSFTPEHKEEYGL